MIIPNKKTIAIVDDDEAIRDSLSWLFASKNYTTSCFANGVDFLAQYTPQGYSSIILDVRMPQMSGLDVLKILQTYSYCPPVLFLTGHGDIPMAVNALKNGASEFIQKPFNSEHILGLIDVYLTQDQKKRHQWGMQQTMKQRLSSLTNREYEVMELMLEGKLNKQVADQLDIAIKTVEVHRSRVLEKMNVKTALALASALRDARI